MNYIKWLFSRWYYWIIVLINFMVNIPKEATIFLEYLGSFAGSMFIIGIILLFIKFIIHMIGKMAKRKKR